MNAHPRPAAYRRLFTLPIRVWTRWISPSTPQRCKYEPSCSRYAAQAIEELGIIRGSILACWRLLRCNPMSHGGLDRLSDRRLFRGRGDVPEGPDQAVHNL